MEAHNHLKQFDLTLDNNEQATFITKGNGPFICYIFGFGSLYLNSLKNYENELTFVTCDGIWSRYKNDPIDENKIKASTLESILNNEKIVIKKIKAYFGCSKICLMGFSGPAAISFKYALENPDDIACIIGTGAGLCELDPTFEKTNDFFYAKASPERIRKFKSSMENYGKLLQGDDKAISLRGANFFTLHDKKKRYLTPNSSYLELVLSLLPKLAYDEEKYKDDALNHWKANPFGQVVNQPMREHFFNNIQPTLNTLDFLKQLDELGSIPVLLIQGEKDFLTPLNEKTKQKIQQYNNIRLKVYSNCAHLTYIENPNQYREDLLNFISLNTPMRINKITDRSTCDSLPSSREEQNQINYNTNYIKK